MSVAGTRSERRWLMDVAASTGGEYAGIRPQTEHELVGYLDMEEGLVPVTGGRSGTILPAEGTRWLHLDGLPSSVDIDPVSSTAIVRGDVGWEALEEAAAAHGLTARFLAGTAAGRGVLSTLARPPLLPPLWLSPIPHARCTGLRAVDRAGVVYEAVAAPRTASGPDFRWLYLGGEGRHGVILAATLTLDRVAPTRTFQGRTATVLDGIRTLLQAAPHRIRAVGNPADSSRVRVVITGDGQEAAHLEKRAREAGLEPAGREAVGTICPGPAGDERCWLVTAPWSIGAAVLASKGARLVCATGGHCTVAVPLRAGRREQQHVAAVQRALDNWPGLVSAVPHGFCLPGYRSEGGHLGRRSDRSDMRRSTGGVG